MPMSPSNPTTKRKLKPAKKPWTDAPSKRSAILGTKKPKLLSKGQAQKVQKNLPSVTPQLRRPSVLDVGHAIGELKKHYPNAHCALHHETAFQLLIATILSAQCTDERVNIVTKVLFAEYPDAVTMAKASVEHLEEIVRSTGFFKNKAKNIKECAQTLVTQYQGQVPRQMHELVALAGVGRKTANVVLGNAYNIPSGVVVDTHVGRLSRRWGWTKSENPEIVEKNLQLLVEQKDWIMLSHWLIWHGRSLCKARKPECENCFLFDRCPRNGL